MKKDRTTIWLTLAAFALVAVALFYQYVTESIRAHIWAEEMRKAGVVPAGVR